MYYQLATMDEAFVFQPMMTCIGNKRKLVKTIEGIILDVKNRLGKEKLSLMDAFSGSTVVSRMLYAHADVLHVNDLEKYACCLAKAYLVRPSPEQEAKVKNHLENMQRLAVNGPFCDGFISEMYAPKCTVNILPDERCFYTRENAMIIDTLRTYCGQVEEDIQHYCIAPLLIKASIHTNTSGVFKGFYKKEGVGHFGGAGENALGRIMTPIQVDVPIWPDGSVNVVCHRGDINTVLDDMARTELDIIYLDPPYNQHPYGSNYFMLNLIESNEKPEHVSRVSGIPLDWNKSSFNYHSLAVTEMTTLLERSLNIAKYVLLSYNNEGILKEADFKNIFEGYEVEKHEFNYDTFKGSRNLRGRSNKVVEIMYLIQKPRM